VVSGRRAVVAVVEASWRYFSERKEIHGSERIPDGV
jgi:hypothetical protein